VEQLVELESMGDVALKGLDAPARVWRVIGARSDRTSLAAMPWVGRSSRCYQRLRPLPKQRRIAAGIGKTRLTQVFAEEARGTC
jgi:hypothetical protein